MSSFFTSNNITIITIIIFTFIKSGISFRCYVCDTSYDKYCKDNPNRYVECPEESNGCVKIINNVLDYKFFDRNGSEISFYGWNGKDTDWKAISYVNNIVDRRCGYNYERYEPDIGCKKIPRINNDYNDNFYDDYDDDKNYSNNIICYCKKELCNYSTISYELKYCQYIFYVIVNIIVFY